MLQSLLEPGDEVIMPTPNWPNMKWAVVLAGEAWFGIVLESTGGLQHAATQPPSV